MTALSQNKAPQTGYKQKEGLVLLCTGLFLCAAEIWKQLYLYFVVFGRNYHVWYLPWQLCSMPMYLCILYGILSRSEHAARAVSVSAACASGPENAARTAASGLSASAPVPENAVRRSSLRTAALRLIATFLADYGMLGGIAALIVHSGFTFPAYPLLTLHGYLWHITLILLSLYITKHRLADITKAGFCQTLPLFFSLAAIAELLNISLHRFGDCDMFYISPYHLSSQPVFSEIDRLLGRIPGIFLYLGAVVLGAFLVHLLLGRLQSRRRLSAAS